MSNVTVRQADREAAVKFANAHIDYPTLVSIDRLAEAFSHHAEQARLEGYQQGVADERERCLGITERQLSDGAFGGIEYSRAAIATAIRNGHTA